MAFVLILSERELEKTLQTGPRGRVDMSAIADTGACVGLVNDACVVYTKVREVPDALNPAHITKLGDYGDERIVGRVAGVQSRSDFEVISAYGEVNKNLLALEAKALLARAAAHKNVQNKTEGMPSVQGSLPRCRI